MVLKNRQPLHLWKTVWPTCLHTAILLKTETLFGENVSTLCEMFFFPKFYVFSDVLLKAQKGSITKVTL